MYFSQKIIETIFLALFAGLSCLNMFKFVVVKKRKFLLEIQNNMSKLIKKVS